MLKRAPDRPPCGPGDEPRVLKICMAGFGAVGQRFVRLLEEKADLLLREYHAEVRVTGICTRSQGALANPAGLSIGALFDQAGHARPFAGHPDAGAMDVPAMLRAAEADVFIELTTLSIRDGEPAFSYMATALEGGMHAITANKGPVAWKYHELRQLAEAADRRFLFETTVMDGTPVFNLAHHSLKGCKILGIRGILNGTTNFLLGELEAGGTPEAAIKKAQAMQLAEADPSMDVDGWDGAAKLCALVNVLMDARMTPPQVQVTGLGTVCPEDVRLAAEHGQRIKYICEAGYEAEALRLSVKPCTLTPDDPLYSVNGTSAAVTLHTDLAGSVTVIQTDPGILQTAYGVFSDLLALF